MRSIHGVVITSAAVVAFVLAGCASSPSTGTSSGSASASATPAAGPLDCDTLAPADLVAGALTGADGVAPEPVAALQPSTGTLALELASAGGLNCSWRSGPAPETVYGDVGVSSYLSVRVLPGAAAQYQPVWAGDTPSTETRDVGGVSASTSFGDSGWQLTAPVGDAWVELRISPPGIDTVGGPFNGVDPEAVFERLADLASPVFATLTSATPAQLSWPGSASLRDGDARCAGGLDPQGIGMALQATSIEAALTDPTLTEPTSFDDAVAGAARAFTCEYTLDGIPSTSVTLITGAGEQFETLRQADLSTAFEPLDLSGSPSFADGDAALRAKVTDGPATPVYLQVGDLVYVVTSYDGATAVAEAILEQKR